MLLSNKPFFTVRSRLSNIISCNSQQVSCSTKFTLFLIFFNVILLNQSTQNLLIFNFLTNFILLTLPYVKVYTSITNVLTVYINQYEFFLMPFFESFVTCNVIKIAWVANVNNFSVTLRYFILTATYFAMCLKNKRFYTRFKNIFLPSIIGKNVVKK